MLTQQQLLAMSDDDYMNPQQLQFFKALLMQNKLEIESQLQTTREEMGSYVREADELDQALLEEENRQRLRMADRQTKLLRKIVSTINRLDEGDYGYCKVSGEAIGLQRLLLRPTADLCAEEKARQETREHHYAKVR
ncbi:TraR/DksA family transcriptional regulator [Halioxenophilus sp. WMMB6]|uniref:TraR/DksA family transcriptional regulator n=1 Tax=Halioxenophilus sp. WMMB6 TaxID=3073815 RepID=UPI00295EDEF7|nr:TraR/DksA C4-type zinc finger protein [Halioxenophilus sp. WMMB6]